MYNKLKSRIMHKLVPCKIYKRDEKWYLVVTLTLEYSYSGFCETKEKRDLWRTQ